MDWVGAITGDPYPDFVSIITNADTGVVMTVQTQSGVFIATTTGTAVSVSAVAIPSAAALGSNNYPSLAPLLQAQDGSFVGTMGRPVDYGVFSYMANFDVSGNIRWSVPNESPMIATADGGVIGASGVTYDQSGNATGMITLSTQSWVGSEYRMPSSSVASISTPPLFPEGTSFWSQAGGNPSANATAFTMCPCVLQSAGVAPGQTSTNSYEHASATRTRPLPDSSDPPFKTWIILLGDPGENRGPNEMFNVGNLFNLAAGTEQDALNLLGNLAQTKRVSSVQDFAAQLQANGPITGGVVYFGHGTQVEYTGDHTTGSQLSPGEQTGASTNVTDNNVSLLSSSQMATSATVTLHACYAGFGSGRYSIAQRIADQLQRIVYAPKAGSFFSVDPNSTSSGGRAPAVPNQKPVYLLQDGGTPLTKFLPHQ